MQIAVCPPVSKSINPHSLKVFKTKKDSWPLLFKVCFRENTSIIIIGILDQMKLLSLTSDSIIQWFVMIVFLPSKQFLLMLVLYLFDRGIYVTFQNNSW